MAVKYRSQISDLGTTVDAGTNGVYIKPDATPDERREKIRALRESLDVPWR